ncbi:MAG: hypothetical protein AB7Q17_00055 [Phycisphaerae bacterium]
MPHAAAGAVAGMLLWLGGCTGAARIEIASLDYNAIEPPAARSSVVTIDRCHWWTDDAGQVWLAFERRTAPLLLPIGEVTFQMYFVLERPPAGKARYYAIAKKEMRAGLRVGPLAARFAPVTGVALLERRGNAQMRGSFRMAVRREVSQLLGGWSRPSSQLMQGSFVATLDAERGKAIADAVRADAE